MRKNFNLLVVLLFCYSGIYGQKLSQKKVTLVWGSTVVETNRGSKISIPNVEGFGLDAQLLPEFAQSWDIEKGLEVASYELLNVQYEIISASSISSEVRTVIAPDIKSELVVANHRNKATLELLMTPVVNDGGVYKKVVSFQLNYATRQSRTSERGTFNRAFNSVLNTGNWYKFAIDTTGVYRINRSFLQSLGIKTNDVDPRTIKIYGNGGAMLPNRNSDFRYDGLQENSIYISGEEDGSFGSSDYILFYAKGPETWDINSTSGIASHRANIFDDKAYYFITFGGEQGKRIQNQNPITEAATQVVTSYDDYTFYEKEEYNLFSVGQQWFGEEMSFEPDQTFVIPFKNLDPNYPVRVRVRGVAESFSASSMSIRVNGQDAFTINYPALVLGSLIKAYAREGNTQMNLSGDSITVEVSFNNNGNPAAKAFLDFIEINGQKLLQVDNTQLSFRSFDAVNSGGVASYEVQNAEEIWDVTDFINPLRVTPEEDGSTFKFKSEANELKQFVALNDVDFYTPEIITSGPIKNQNLHGIQDIDYLIVTRGFLMNEAEVLADFHRDRGLTVEVVDLEEVYNEFGSGSPDLTAIRDYVRYLYDNASNVENRIKYVLLFGDASYDYKDRIIGNNNIVPAVLAYESFNLATSYLTDDYYGMMDPNEGLLTFADKQDVATGRFPVTTIQQAKEAVNKAMTYSSSESYGDWRNLVTVVADDLDVATEFTIQQSMENIADTIRVRKPLLNVKKIYADAFVQVSTAGGERYPDVYDEIENTQAKGTLLLNYFGHGGEDGWASERILDIPMVRALSNINTLPLIITITCEFSRFDNPLRLSGGEFLIWNADGGSTSLITTTREIYVNVGRVFNDRLMRVLLNFDNENLTIAEGLMSVKNQFSTSQRLFIYFLGDPAMDLAVPEPDVRLTHMNGIDISQSIDTIKALSRVTLEGAVTDSNGNVLSDYNGELSTIVFDKPITKTTLDNDNFGRTMEFDALESKIFRGLSSVANGRFEFDFVAPRDLRIAYGQGKISFYADNDDVDKAGYNFDVTIGGINLDAPEDNLGPDIELFMNDESFVDGGNTNGSPYLLALLSDENGINTSITSVDHDIVAILDGETSNPYVLNDFYQTELDDYTRGRVRFPFRDLEPGLHTLELCAWDTYNNSSCATLNFFVVSDSEMVLDNVLNYPNPFVNYTEFWFNHNKPNEPLDVQVQIFTVSGKLVKTINQTVNSTGNLSRSITWDGLDDFGDKIGKGVYVYKLNVKSTLSDVSAEKYEKLVILQ
ncbi:type IX secretion system sortase PorU [Urechidicola sp. KH5]